MIDKIMTAIMVGCVIVLLYVLFALLPKQVERESAAKAIAEENGCTFLGHPRDLNTVFFFDCNGTVIVKRIK